MEQKQQSDFELYEQIRSEIYGQENKNLNELLSLILKRGIPILIDLFNFQIFGEIIYDELICQDLSLYYKILYLAKQKFLKIAEQKQDIEIYYSENFEFCEKEFQERFPQFDQQILRNDIDKKIQFNESEQLFIDFYQKLININNQKISKEDLHIQIYQHIEMYIKLIFETEANAGEHDPDLKIFNKIIIENLSNLYRNMEDFIRQEQAISQSNFITNNEINQNDIDVQNGNINYKNPAQNKHYQNQDINNKNKQQKIINISKLENMNYQLNGINQVNDVINKQNYYDDELNEGEEGKEEEEEQDLEYIMQKQKLSRQNRPEEERKNLEGFDKYYDPLEKLNSESEDNSQLREKQKKVCCRTYFVKGENLPLENEVIEYKNYQWPIENSSFIIDKLQKLICGMLNSKGGTILIGVHDNSFKVLGLNLTIKQQEEYEQFIINKVLNNQSVGIFDPKITIDDDEISLRFIPVMNEQNQWLQGKWIIKLQIKPKKSQQVYTLHNKNKEDEPSCFIRLDGLNRQQNGLNLMQFIYDKSKSYFTDNFEEIHECFSEPDRQGVMQCKKLEKVQEKLQEKVQEKYKQKVKQNKKQMQNSKHQVVTSVVKNQNKKEVYYFPKLEEPIDEPLYVNKTEIIRQNFSDQTKIFKNVQKLQI